MQPSFLIRKANEGIVNWVSRSRLSPEDRSLALKDWSLVSSEGIDKFIIPNDGRLFDDELKGLPESIHIPFSEITLEYLIQSKRNSGVVIYSEESEQDILIRAYIQETETIWLPWPIESRIPKNSANSQTRDVTHTFLYYLREEFNADQETINKLTLSQTTEAVRPVLELIEALSCSNVRHEKVLPKKRHRPSRRRFPSYEYRVLVIDTPLEHSYKEHQGGSHRSPRQHLRRGHIRVYSRGSKDEHKIWINSIVVGKSDHGVIEKEYYVK